MEDDHELLDWGHEDEPAVAIHHSDRRPLDVDDAEDAVSLGGDEEDEFLTYQSRVPQDHPPSPPLPASKLKQDTPKATSPPHSQELPPSADQPVLPIRPLVHALPPKPVVSSVPFVYATHPSIIEATAMASRADRDKRNGASSKPSVYDPGDSLPAGWEVKYPRNGRGVYYYNIHTQESTWTCPAAPSSRDKRSERSDRRDDSLDTHSSTRNGETRVGRSDNSDMSYDDRHYRPGELARREERPARSTQLMDSYVPDSYSPEHRNSRPSPPSPRPRERDLTPPPRRPPSPSDSYDGAKSSYRETPPTVPSSAQDRIRARDDVPRERTRERRQRDDTPPSQTERRNPPRDTERSSTTRPRSPASYTRSQEPANTTPHPSVKPPQPVPEAPAAARKSRFSQVDATVQHPHRSSESRDVVLRRARTDDISRARYVDDLPSSRSMSDLRGDNTLTYPASDAQRPLSRKRSPLPPQDEAYFPGPTPASAQRGGSHPSGPGGSVPTSVLDHRLVTRIAHDDPLRGLNRRSPSPPPLPQPRVLPAERGDHGHSRWSKPPMNGPSQLDSRNTHEFPRGRVHDTAMDVDDAPLPRSSDPPTKQIPPRRLALQDDLPRYPRAMLNPDNDGPPRGVRETRDMTDLRYRSGPDNSSRFGPPRDRLGTERHFVEQSGSQQKEPYRGVEARPLPTGSNVKLSGTNNTPIGARSKFANSAPPAPPSSVHRTPTTASGGNGEPIVLRRERVHKDHERPSSRLDGDRGPPMEQLRREDVRRSPSSNSRAAPPAEPTATPTRPSRAALGLSRFGPPIVKEKPEPVRLQTNASSESQSSEPIPEGSAHATPPPPSRESSAVSFKDMTVPSGRPSHLPPRPASPPRGYRFRPGDTNNPLLRPNAPSLVPHDSRHDEINAEGPPRPKPPSPMPRKRSIETYPSDPPPAPRDNRAPYSPERSRNIFRESEANHHVARPPPPPPSVIQEDDHERAEPAMHPERALMLQANGLPPRPLSILGRVKSGRGFKRDEERSHERVEPLRLGGGGRYDSVSPGGERRRYPENDHPVGYGGGGGGGASLLDRLSLDEGNRVSPSLRERVQLPSKRDREEMLGGDLIFDPDGDDYDGSKRVRRRATRIRKGRG